MAHHAVAPRHDPHALAKQHFAELLARQLTAAMADDGVEALILVAPPRILQTIRGELRADAQDRIVGSLEKDLVKTPDEDLRPHLQRWLPPLHRAGLPPT